MSTRATKTIDNIGIQSYLDYEENRKYFDEKLVGDSKEVARQLGVDVFEPILISEYQILFELGTKGGPFSLMPSPQKYNEQKKRLFMHQLAPKLGPEDLMETLMGRIAGQRDQEKDERRQSAHSWEVDQELVEIDKESYQLIQLMQDINILNKMIEQVNAERYRYSKG